MFKFPTTALSAALLALGSLAATPAMATIVSYDLSINDPVFNSASGNFNVPDFQLVNTSSSGIQITDFSMTIGDTDFNFDFVRIQTAFNDPGADLTYALDTVGLVNDGVGEDVLEYSFTGFDGGDIFRFEVDVDPDVGSPSQDFREALFPLAQITVGFSDGSVFSQLLNPTTPTQSSFAFEERTIVPVPLPSGLALYLGTALIGGGIAARKQRGRA